MTAKDTSPAAPEAAKPPPKSPGVWLFALGFAFPAAVIAFEAVTRFCASALFDPMPTPGHFLLVVLAPVSVAWLWRHLQRENPQPMSALMAMIVGVGLAVSLFYALLFLPLYPISVVAILFYGLGLLPFAPLAVFVCGVTLLARARKRMAKAPRHGWVWAGVGAGVLALTALDLPQAATGYAVKIAAQSPTNEAGALALMRSVGSKNLLLRMCYESTGRPAGPLSALVFFGHPWFAPLLDEAPLSSTGAAQLLYYRLTGDPYTAKQPPFNGGPWSFADRMEWDRDQGGSVVGARVRGLSLASSRIDGVIAGQDASGYLEWTMEFAADSAGEARATLVLPPGGVVSRATLWVAGKEREAVFTSRGQARDAYEQVVVRERRDPLLVTTQGADRVMVQVFPVLPIEGAKIRIGITAPLDLSTPQAARLALPVIADRNFNIDAALRHEVWVEGNGQAQAGGAEITLSNPNPGAFRLRGALDDQTLTRKRPQLTVMRPQSESMAFTPTRAITAATTGKTAPKPGFIVQSVAYADNSIVDAIVFVLDGGKSAREGAGAISAALNAVAPGRTVGLIIAGEQRVSVAPAPLDGGHRAKLEAALQRHKPAGGQDNVAALQDAILVLEPFQKGVVVWLHGPQPAPFSRSSAKLEQTLARAQRLPQLALYPLALGPNIALRDSAWYWNAQTLAWSGDAKADLTAWAKAETAPTRLTVTRSETAQKPALPAGAFHIARLWARDQIAALSATGVETDRAKGVDLARAYGLVAPISGAVVLETDEDNKRAGLTAPDAASVPTVPEPEQWMLLIMVCGLVFWAIWRRRQSVSHT